MILARCPHCETTFRAEPEALKQRGGKVRCGQCRRVFNALDHLLVDPAAATPVVVPPAFTLTAPPSTAPTVDRPPAVAAETADADQAAPDAGGAETPAAATDETGPAEDQTGPAEESAADDETVPVEENGPAGAEATVAIEAVDHTAGETAPVADPLLDDTTQIAARDSREIPGYSKWAEGTLSAPPAHFDDAHRSGWLAVFSAVVLGLMLLVQAVHHWRLEIAQRWPETRPWLEEACRSANCTVPYPRDASLISLEASELQIDHERGNMLVLNLTLKNRAPYAQAFPSIELTLTDTRDQVVVRRILPPAEWLPDLDRNAAQVLSSQASTPPAFPAEKEIAARLWIDAKDTGAVGYRIFVFYP